MDVALEPGLRALLDTLAASQGSMKAQEFDRVLRLFPKPGGGLYSKRALIEAFDQLARSGADTPCAREDLVAALQVSPTRTHSGVTPVTVFTMPHPCPGTCIFCPNDVRMPKSYSLEERGSHEGARHGFDPYQQTMARLHAYRAAGHPCQKIELLVLGGTWSSYPRSYQRWFVLRCFQALNEFSHSTKRPEPPQVELSTLDRRSARGRYNRLVKSLPQFQGVDASWGELREAQRMNEESSARCVGLVLETRPDHIDAAELLRMRRLGTTKIQLGVQSIRDSVLDANRRGHRVDATREAFGLLRSGGFKILAHWMPNLLGSTPEADLEEYDRLFADPDFRPDELKIYPCVLDPTAELMREHEAGRWRAYSSEDLDRLLETVLLRTPRYCRIARVMRDLPASDGSPSGSRASRRHDLERELRARGAIMRDIRARELGTQKPNGEFQLRRSEYEGSKGTEVFLEWVDDHDQIAGFLRLFLPPPESAFTKELQDGALLRELHVYGRAAGIGLRDRHSAQHRGLGKALVAAAAERCKKADIRKCASSLLWGHARTIGDSGLKTAISISTAFSSPPCH